MKSPLTKEARPQAAAGVQLVTFLVGSEEYGLDIRCISEVVRPLRITPLPRMPQFVEGVIDLRGVIIPVVDLRRRFALAVTADNPRAMRMLITRGALAGNQLLGLVVDRVREVVDLPAAGILPAPDAARGQHAEFITGMGKIADRLIILLDVARILSRQERAQMVEAGNAGP